MRTVGKPAVLDELTRRVRSVQLDSPRQWGKMNVQQMLSHLARSMEWVLISGGDEQPAWDGRPSRLIKFIAFRVPLPWPRGIPNPNDPASVDVSAEELESLRLRVIEALEGMSRWEASDVAPSHPAFGPLTTWEWRRWAFKHADHHLKQFGA